MSKVCKACKQTNLCLNSDNLVPEFAPGEKLLQADLLPPSSFICEVSWLYRRQKDVIKTDVGFSICQKQMIGNKGSRDCDLFLESILLHEQS